MWRTAKLFIPFLSNQKLFLGIIDIKPDETIKQAVDRQRNKFNISFKDFSVEIINL